MKHLLISLTLYLCGISTHAQTINWLWANKAGTDMANELGNSILSDTAGNIYVAGSFTTDTLVFGSSVLVNKSTNGGADIFIVKYDPAGKVLWAANTGGNGNEILPAIALDASGNIIVTGSYTSSSFSFGSYTLSAIGEYDIFTVKYDAAGNELWAKSAGGTLTEGGNSIATDAAGNIFVTGDFKSASIMCDTSKLTNASSSNYSDLFILKYNASGKLLWAKRAGGQGIDHGFGIATDGSGNAILTGSFSGISVAFGSKTLTNKGAGTTDAFIVKYSPAGNVIWAKNPGGPSYDQSQAICTDKAGNIYITGYFQPTSMAFDAITLTNSGGLDVFVAKYDSSGNALWAKGANGTSSEIGYGIAVDKSGNVYTTGIYYSPTVVFGTTTLTNSTPAGEYDIYVVKYDASGKVIWAKSAGGIAYDESRAVCSDADGNAYITGSYKKTINFGPLSLKPTVFSILADAFVAKIGLGCSKPYTPVATQDPGNCLKFNFKTKNPELNAFKWYFGDGDTSTARHPSHTYSAWSKYTIKLVAGFDSSSVHCRDSITFPWDIYCKFCGIKDSLVLTSDTAKPYEATLNNYSTGTIHKHFWHISDGFTSTQASFVHIITIGGPITITYIATDTITNCIDTVIIKFTIDSLGHIKRNAFTINIIYHGTPTNGLQILKEEAPYKLYPNPFSTNMTLTGNIESITSLLLFNTLGQQIPVTCIQENKQWVIKTADDLTKGIYFMQVYTATGNGWIKVVRE